MPHADVVPRHQAPLRGARSIAILAVDGMSPFHLAVPLLVFAEHRPELGLPRFDVRICSLRAGPVSSGLGVTIEAATGLRGLQGADVVIVPGWPDVGREPPAAMLEVLRRAHRRGATVVGLCLGAFVLAEAGLLDRQRATTHWNWAGVFRERYPDVELDPDVLYVHGRGVLTSAGTAASMDACLHLLRSIVGVQLANRLARRIVMAPHRAGGQAQFIDEPLPASPAADRLGKVLAWVAGRLQENHTLDSLSARAAMSRRTFTRHFHRSTGTSVMRWLLQQRLAAAARLLEGGTQSVEDIATKVGFGSAVSLRQQFARVYGLSPQAYRRQFQSPRSPPSPSRRVARRSSAGSVLSRVGVGSEP